MKGERPILADSEEGSTGGDAVGAVLALMSTK
jgi:hypothetical protein